MLKKKLKEYFVNTHFNRFLLTERSKINFETKIDFTWDHPYKLIYRIQDFRIYFDGLKGKPNTHLLTLDNYYYYYYYYLAK